MDLAIDTPVTETETKSERLAALRQATAEARSGVTAYQKRELHRWYEAYTGEPVPASKTVEELAQLFLNPPCQWAKGAPRGFVAVTAVTAVIKDGKLKYLDKCKEHLVGVDLSEEDVRQLLEGKVAALLPCVTVRVLARQWCRTLDPNPLGVRGELALYRGAVNDRFLEQAEQLGQIEIVQEIGRYAGKPESLGQCPTPRPRDPDGRTYLSNYKGAAGRGEAAAVGAGGGPRTHEPLPRTLDALLPEPPKHIRNPEWHETPMVRVKPNSDLHLEHFDLFDQQEVKVPEWLACVLNVRRNRHNEPMVDFIDAPSEPGRRFIADVAEHAAAYPDAKTDDVTFPVYSLV